MYVLFSLVTIPISHLTAVVKVVKSDLLVTVNVVITPVDGTILESSIQLESNTGTLPALVPTSLLAAVHRVGLCNKSEYSPENATVLSSPLN
jgi:hypothetical protein